PPIGHIEAAVVVDADVAGPNQWQLLAGTRPVLGGQRAHTAIGVYDLQRGTYRIVWWTDRSEKLRASFEVIRPRPDPKSGTAVLADHQPAVRKPAHPVRSAA